MPSTSSSEWIPRWRRSLMKSARAVGMLPMPSWTVHPSSINSATFRPICSSICLVQLQVPHQGTVEVYKVIYQRNWDDHITVCPGQVFVHFQNHQICHVDHIALNNRTHREGDQPIRIWRCADAKQHTAVRHAPAAYQTRLDAGYWACTTLSPRHAPPDQARRRTSFR